MINKKEIESLIYLLEDTDEEVVEQVENRIISLGAAIVPDLEAQLYLTHNSLQIQRLQSLLKRLRYDGLIDYFRTWKDAGAQDLLGAVINIAKIKYPDIDRQEIEIQIDKIKLDAWLELQYDLTSYEKVRILNHIFYNVHLYQGDSEDYHNSDNSFINKVLERKRGNPISLAIIYSLVAQRLNIPIFGVNLPQHFVLGYKADGDYELIKAYNELSSFNGNETGEVLFYINPFSQGLILSHDSIKAFLTQINIETREEYFKICSNIDIVQRIIRNLLFAFDKEKNTLMVQILENMMTVLSKDENEL
jgi:regulator of sirC expression with transglutaminase-like and TPR domain